MRPHGGARGGARWPWGLRAASEKRNDRRGRKACRLARGHGEALSKCNTNGSSTTAQPDRHLGSSISILIRAKAKRSDYLDQCMDDGP